MIFGMPSVRTYSSLLARFLQDKQRRPELQVGDNRSPHATPTTKAQRDQMNGKFPALARCTPAQSLTYRINLCLGTRYWGFDTSSVSQGTLKLGSPSRPPSPDLSAVILVSLSKGSS